MARAPRTVTDKFTIDIKQNNAISVLNQNITSFSNSVTANANRITTLKNSVNTINTSFNAHKSTISDLKARLSEIEDNIDILQNWVAPDIFNMMLLKADIINIDPNRSGKQNIIDLNDYITLHGSDTFSVIQPSTSNLEAGKKYYLEVEGEYVTNSGIEGLVDLATWPVRLYKYTRTESPTNTQSAGLTGETASAYKEKLAVIYGSVTTNSGGINKHYFKSQTDIFNDTRRVDSQGVKFRYICTFIADETLRVVSGGNATQTVYAIRLQTMNDAKIFNLQAQMIKLS